MKQKITQLENQIKCWKEQLQNPEMHPSNVDRRWRDIYKAQNEISRLRLSISTNPDPPIQQGVSSIGDGSHAGSHQI